MCRRGALGPVLAVDLTVLGEELDLMILRVFSNLSDSKYLVTESHDHMQNRGWCVPKQGNTQQVVDI